jgi:glycosyltransferase involved in cell wall biosynthesis
VTPWPETSGSRVRVASTVRALGRLGHVDVFCISGERWLAAPHPGYDFVDRWRVVERPRRRQDLGRLGWLLDVHSPRELGTLDYSQIRTDFHDWARTHYDAVWLAGGGEAFRAVGTLAGGPKIVSFDDLHDHKAASQLAIANAVAGQPGQARRRLDVQAVRLNQRRWRAYQRRISAAVDAVVVCSELDRQRLGVPNATVVPNIYRAPVHPAGKVRVGTPPTVSIIGQMHYAPNADGVTFFVREVLPELRSLVPGVQVRLIGEPDDAVRGLGEVPDVTVTGLVPDITEELARADLAAVPIRFGGGTRIKILEAFAHCIPVVSTTVGAEGLDATDGEHLLIADDAGSFARRCAELLTDERRREALTTAAHAHWQQRFTNEALETAVMNVVGNLQSRNEPLSLPSTTSANS